MTAHSGNFLRRAAEFAGSSTLALVLASAAFAQEPLQFNVPYRCPGGITYTISPCISNGRYETCNWREEKNGQLVVDAVSVRTQMYGRLQGCTVDSPPKPPASGPASQRNSSQTLNPTYLKEFPSVDQIMKIQGSDPKDTTYRQLGAFRQFKQMIQDLAGSRWYQNKLTDDETRIFGDYDLAYNNLGKPLDFPLDGYGAMGSFRNQLFKQFSMTQVQALWNKQNDDFQARHAPAAASPQQPPPGPAQMTAGQPIRNDPGTLETRRCLELGGSELQCMGNGLKTGMIDMLGGKPIMDAISGSPITGLRITGSFKAASGLLLGFAEDGVSISGCGKIISANHRYTVGRAMNQYMIQIESQPKPLLVALVADGRIAGPPVADISGQVITGYTTSTVGTKDLTTGQWVPGSLHDVQTPIYEPRTEHCSIGNLQPGPAVAPDTGMIDQIVSIFSDSPAAQKNVVSPGARMAGVFTGPGGLKIEFHGGSAVIDCGEAHVTAQYSLINSANGVAIAMKNGASPFTLVLQSNGSLAGIGTINVAGRLIAGTNDTGVVYRPVTTQCTVGTLVAAK